MKRSFVNIIKILLFVITFSCAFYYFLEWDTLGRFAMSMAHSRLERQGMRLNYSDVAAEQGGFTVNNLALSGSANVSLSSITIKPQLAASVLSLAPVCEISFRGANVRLGQVLNFGDGGFLLTAGRNEILLENLETNGNFALNGFLTVNLATMKLGRTEARLDVPATFEQGMGMLQNFLPLVQDGGKWYLRRQ
ncbi:MAG: hypothetical protein IJS40_04235 [Synergistaceae bacterium]|nr:hypothetical protein [Synergistaceae bacterium]